MTNKEIFVPHFKDIKDEIYWKNEIEIVNHRKGLYLNISVFNLILMTILKYLKIYINKMKKKEKKIPHKKFKNLIEKEQINIPVNIYMTSHFSGLVQVLK